MGKSITCINNCHCGHFSASVEKGHDITRDNSHACPADLLVSLLPVALPFTPASSSQEDQIARSWENLHPFGTFGNKGNEVIDIYSRLASHFAKLPYNPSISQAGRT